MSQGRRKGYVLKYRVPHAAVGSASGGPYAIAEQIGGHSAGWRWPTALAVTLGVHALLVFLAFLGDQEHRPVAPKPQQVVTLERPPPPPEAPPEAPPPPPPKVHRAPPAASEAGKVVAAAPDPSQPLDMTSFSMPVGKSDSYAGGFTAPAGTSTKEVPEPPKVVVRPSGKARPAGPARRDWSCPWPEEEGSSDLHDAAVRIRIHVGKDGRATSVDVLSSPKESFAQAAQACALAEPFRPELDDGGNAVAGLTPPISVHFVR